MRPSLSASVEALDALEPQYRAHYLAADARQTSIAIAVWLIPSLLFAYSDYLIFGSSPRFAVSLALRLVFFLFSVYTIFALLKVATARDYDKIFLRWAAFATIVVLFFNYSWAPYVPPNDSFTILILFSAYMVFPNRFIVRLVPPLTLSIGNFVLQLWVAEPDSSYSMLTMIVAIVMANVLGIIFSSSLHKYRRTEFKAFLEETRIKEELSRLASTDDLTGILNRRKLMQLATDVFERFQGGNRRFAVLMIDIDHFKKLNDDYGHVVGDLILSKFTAFVANKLSKDYIWGRFGGEEFVLIMPNVSSEQAKLIAERLRLSLNEDSISWQGEPLTFTISIGLTEVREQDQSFEGILKRADEALYIAKRNGRNRTEML